MARASIPAPADSVPFGSAVLWGGGMCLFALIGTFGAVGVIGIGLLGLDLSAGPMTLPGLMLIALAGAQGPLYLGLFVGLEPNVALLLVSLIAVFAALYAGYQVTFNAGGPRLDRSRAIIYGGSIAVGWIVIMALLLFVIPMALSETIEVTLIPMGVLLPSGLIALGFSAVFSGVFGSVGGVLANR